MGLFKRIKQRKQSQKANTNHNVPFMLEMLEPRLLLSASLDGTIATMLSSSLDQLYGDMNSFISSESNLDTPLPLINQVEGTSFEDAVKKAPTIRDLLAIDVDLNGDGQVGGSGDLNGDELNDSADDAIRTAETTLDGWDTNADDKVDFLEFFKANFIDAIKNELASPSSTDPADFATFLGNLDVDKTFNSVLPDLPGDLMDFIGGITPTISATNLSNANQVAFHINFDLAATKELPIDLGRAADDYGLSFPDTNDSTPGNQGVTVEASVNFSMEFGVLTSGETPVANDDLFLEVNDLVVGVLATVDPFNIKFNLGFLGLETFTNSGDTSNITLDAEVTADFVDPTTPTTLGFSEGQFGNTEAGGVIVANSVPASFVLSDSLFSELETAMPSR